MAMLNKQRVFHTEADFVLNYEVVHSGWMLAMPRVHRSQDIKQINHGYLWGDKVNLPSECDCHYRDSPRNSWRKTKHEPNQPASEHLCCFAW